MGRNILVFKRFIYWIILFTIFTQLFIAILPKVANAQGSKATTEQIAQTWAVLSIVSGGTGDHCSFNGGISKSQASEYDWFSANDVIDIGYANGNPGETKCSDVESWFKPALRLWGLESTGYDKILTEKLGYLRNAETGMYTIDASFTARENLKKSIPSQFMQDGGPSDAVKYASWYSAFVTGCGAKVIDNPSVDDISNTNNSKDQYFKVKTPTGQRQVEEKIYKTDKGAKDVISVGWNIGANHGGVADCREIVDKLNTSGWAEAMAATGDADKLPIPGAGENPGGNESDPLDNCKTALKPFGWVLCYIAEGADKFYGFFASTVQNTLFINANTYQTTSLKTSWQIFANLADAILVLIALIMVAGQIFNFEIFSAYTIKKVLPRLVISAILIQLSWFLCITLITLFNALGSGIYWLMLAPFDFTSKGDGGFISISQIFAKVIPKGDTFSASDAIFIGAAGATGLAALVLTPGAWGMLIIAAIGIIISIAVALITLFIRSMLIIILLVIAPVALVFWILPGTESIWKMWWKLFSRLLMMYPLIMLLFAGGAVAATIITSGTKTDETGSLVYIMALVAYFAPMFMIPWTYKFAGSAFSTIGNLTNKAGGLAKGTSKKAVEGGGKHLRSFAGSQYRPGGSKFRNALARIGSGTALPTHANSIKAATISAQRREEQIKNASFMQQEALRSINKPETGTDGAITKDVPTLQSEYLQKQALKGNQYERQAAFNTLAQRQDFGGLRAVRDKAEPDDFTQLLTTSNQFGSLTGSARDLTHAPSNDLGIDTLTKGDKSFFGSAKSFAGTDKSIFSYKENKDKLLANIGKVGEEGDEYAAYTSMVQNYANDQEAFYRELGQEHQAFIREAVAKGKVMSSFIPPGRTP